jgi:hypothetical protein
MRYSRNSQPHCQSYRNRLILKRYQSFLYYLLHFLTSQFQVTFNGTEYKIEVFLVCDMKCLARILGFYEVYKPVAFWKCCWCHVDKLNIVDFDIENWPFRDINKMFQASEQELSEADSCGTTVCSFFFSFYPFFFSHTK